MASLGSLVVQLAVDTARFQGDLGRAASIAESRMRGIKDTSAKALGAITVAATAAGTALVYALKTAIDRADNMRDLAAAAGVTVEQMSRLAFAAKQSGTEVEVVAKALERLAKDGAADANAELLAIADQFARMPDGAAKTALAIEKFGIKLGPGLIPLLNEGSRGLAEMARRSDELGATLTTAAAEGADQFNDRLSEIRATVDGLQNSLAAQMLPVLNQLSRAMLEASTNAASLDKAAKQLATGMKLLIDVGYSTYSVFNNLGTAIGAIAAASVAAAKGQFSTAVDILKASNAEQIENERRANEFLKKLWDDRAGLAVASAGRIAQATAEQSLANEQWALRSLLNPPTEQPKSKQPRAGSGPSDDQFSISADSLTAMAESKRRVDEYYSGIEFRAGITQGIAEQSAAGIREISAAMAENYQQIESENLAMAAFAEEAARNIQSSFAQFLFDPFKDGLSVMLAGFADTLRRMVAELAAQELLTSFFSWGAGLGGGIGKFFGSLGAGLSGTRAGGGPVSAGGLYLVGEKGPELLQMGQQAGTVIPQTAMSGGLTFNQTVSIDARGADADRIMALMPAWSAMTKSQTIAAVRDLIGRGRLV